jgi:hypothetical protein
MKENNMREITVKLKFEEDYCGYNADIPHIIQYALENYMKIDLEDDQIIKKGWTVEVTETTVNETVRCKYIGIGSSLASYIVCDENHNIIGYADTLGMIDYDRDFKPITYNNKIEVISVDESVWD